MYHPEIRTYLSTFAKNNCIEVTVTMPPAVLKTPSDT